MRAGIGAGGVLALALLVTVGAPEGTVQRPAHHATTGFQNLEPIDQGGLDVALPFFVRRIAGFWRDRSGAPVAVANDGAFLRENARHSQPTVTWIGHATVFVQMDHVSFLTDPIWSATASPVSFAGPRRYVEPAMPLAALPPIDFVVISHNHYDHLDLVTLRALANGTTRFLVPLGVGTLLRAHGITPVEELDWWESRRVGDVEVTCVPARHWSGRGLTDRRATLWSGWVVRGATRRFFFAGDTGYARVFTEIGERLGPFGLAALPIGAYEPKAMMRHVHLNPEEAIQVGLDVGATRMLGVHYGTFDLTDEPLEDPPRRFQADAAARGLGERVWTPPLGETRTW